MRLSKDLIGKPVITVNDGRIVGNVKDIYLTSGLDELAGIHLGKEGILRRKSLIVPAGKVVVFGIDVVLVESADVVTDNRKLKEAGSWVMLDKLQGREVDTPGGTKVGVIGDVVLDEQGAITSYALSRVYVEGPISERRMVAREAVIDTGNEDGVMTIDIARAERPGEIAAGSAEAPDSKSAEEPSADALSEPESDDEQPSADAGSPADETQEKSVGDA